MPHVKNALGEKEGKFRKKGIGHRPALKGHEPGERTREQNPDMHSRGTRGKRGKDYYADYVTATLQDLLRSCWNLVFTRVSG